MPMNPWLVPLLVIALDQASKWWADSVLRAGPIEVFSWFNLSLAYNPGAAFSFLADAGGWQKWFFAGVAGIAVIWLSAWRRGLGAGEGAQRLAIDLIIAGAIGNLIDRLRLGHVIDFIDWHYAGWHWPAFNIADAAISVGAALWIILSLRGGKRGDTRA